MDPEPGIYQGNRYLIFGPYEDGGCSSVDWGWDTHENKWVVLKKLKSENLKRVQEEIDLSRLFGDIPQCVPCRDYFTLEVPRKQYVLVFEYIDHIPLREVIPKMSLLDICRFSGQFLWLMNKLHDRGLIHRDIKPGNILLDKTKLDLRIIDFGLCVLGTKENGKYMWKKVSPRSGTPQFMSPEQERAEDYFSPTPGMDIWSFGCILMEWWMGRGPAFSSKSSEKWEFWSKLWINGNLQLKRRSSKLEMDREFFRSLKKVNCELDDELFIDFMELVLEPYPSKRWSAKKLLTHPFITQNSYQTCFLYDLSMRVLQD